MSKERKKRGFEPEFGKKAKRASPSPPPPPHPPGPDPAPLGEIAQPTLDLPKGGPDIGPLGKLQQKIGRD